MNDLPPQFFIDPALTKRAAIIKFDQMIVARDKDTDFADKIIETELPGVLNWLIAGLKWLLKTRRLDTPPCCVAEMEQIRSDVDPLCGWLDENGYYLGNDVSISVRSAFTAFCDYCKENGNHAPSKKKFTQRLRNLGYEVSAPNGHVGMSLFYSRSESPDTENQEENVEQMGNDLTQDAQSFPDDSPFIPRFEPRNTGMGNEGNDNLGQGFNREDSWGVSDYEKIGNKKKRKPVYAVYDPDPDGEWATEPVPYIQHQYRGFPDEEWEVPIVECQLYNIDEVLAEMDYYRFCDYWNRTVTTLDFGCIGG